MSYLLMHRLIYSKLPSQLLCLSLTYNSNSPGLLTALVHIHSHRHTKFDFYAIECVFHGNSLTLKGCKCYNPIYKWLYTSIVTLLETTPFYPKSSIQGENRNEFQPQGNLNSDVILEFPHLHSQYLHSS